MNRQQRRKRRRKIAAKRERRLNEKFFLELELERDLVDIEEKPLPVPVEEPEETVEELDPGFIRVEKRIYGPDGEYIRSEYIVQESKQGRGGIHWRKYDIYQYLRDSSKRRIALLEKNLRYGKRDDHISRCPCGTLTTNVGMCVFCFRGYAEPPDHEFSLHVHGDRQLMRRIEEQYLKCGMGVDAFLNVYDSPTRRWEGRDTDYEW